MGSHLQPRDQVPHFAVVDVNGSRVAYDDLWQRKHLLLICVGATASEDDAYIASIRARAVDLTAHGTACIVTSEPVDGVPQPGVVVADRWGEVFLASETLVPVPQLLEWIRYVQMQCPECQGETR